MPLRDKIFLVWNYGKAQFMIGFVYNALCTSMLLYDFSYALFVDAFIIKAIVYVITLYLVRQFRKRDAIFFYINLGFSDRKLQLSVLLADFLAIAIMMTTALLLHG